MAFSCRIVRDNFDRVIGVEAPNGKSSILFRSAVEYLNNSKTEYDEEIFNDAATIVVSTELKEFQDFHTDEEGNLNYRTDINGEPVLEDVLTFLKSTEKSKMNEINKSDFEDFKNQFSEFNYETFEEKLKSAFLDKDGNFLVNEQKLLNSELYNQLEIDNILEDKNLQEKIKNNILSLNKENFSDIDSGSFLNVTSGGFNSFGKQKTYNSDNLLKLILNTTTQASNQEEFDTLLSQAVSEDIYEAISNNQDVYDTLLNLSINLKSVEVKTFENGAVKNVLNRDLFNELKETLIVSNISEETIYNLEVLSDIDYDVIMNDLDNVIELTKSIESDLVASNIDVIGLSNKLVTEDVEKVQSFIKALNTFSKSVASGIINDSLIETFSDIHNDFFNNENKTEFVNIDSFDQDVVKIDNKISKLDAYNNGYLKVADGYYMRVTNESYEEILSSLLDLYQTGENLLEGTIPNNLKSEVQYRNYLNNLIMSELNDFGEVVNEDNLEVYKAVKVLEILHGIENVEDNKTNNYKQDKDALKGKDLEYLSFNFFSDLNNIILLSKLTGNELYDKIFQYIEFKENELSIKENEPVVISRIQNILTDNNKVLKELKDYFKPVSVENNPSIEDLRESYFFNNDFVKPINTDYKIVNGQLTSPSVNEDFVYNNGKVYEKIDNVDGVNIYSQLVERNGKIEVQSMNKNVVEQNTIGNEVKLNNNYSQTQKENLLDDLTKCNG